MRQGHRYYSNGRKQSVCGDLLVKGDGMQIALKYEALAKEAWIVGDGRLYHVYLNHAEHWRKGDEG